jgi:hypothetical protein
VFPFQKCKNFNLATVFSEFGHSRSQRANHQTIEAARQSLGGKPKRVPSYMSAGFGRSVKQLVCSTNFGFSVPVPFCSLELRICFFKQLSLFGLPVLMCVPVQFTGQSGLANKVPTGLFFKFMIP